MKRGLPLVAYGSSDEEDASDEVEETEAAPPPKKRKLPALSSALLPTVPLDNPSLHEGRVRTTPHVEGQYAAYVYIPIQLERKSSLSKLLRRIFARAKETAPTLHSIGNFEEQKNGELAELHVSLSRPIFLRAHQRDDLKRAVKQIARSCHPFDASFATFSNLENDERTRAFLTVEIGAGHVELSVMTEALVPMLRYIRQKEFYAQPRFHASIAWALLSSPPKSSNTQDSSVEPADAVTPAATPLSDMPTSLESLDSEARSQTDESKQFPQIECLPPDLISMLKNEFGAALVDHTTATFYINTVCVRIGREVSRWRLGSQ